MKKIAMIYNEQEVATPIEVNFPFISKKIYGTIKPDMSAKYKKVITFSNTIAAIRRGLLTTYNT
jgi:hypothetical protein